MLAVTEAVAKTTLVRVLSVHNFYRFAGGEDRVVAAEENMLKSRGHGVSLFQDSNTRIQGGSLSTGLQTIWNPESGRQLERVVRKTQADVVHFHNTFPLISPSTYYAARKAGAAVVQTLHNYRLVCPGATLFRDGHVCEECVDATCFTPALRHGCYRHSRTATGAAVAMLMTHRVAHTWDRKVDFYISPSKFARGKFIEGGLPAEQIFVKPNFVDADPGVGDGQGRYALFVGRLSQEKGVHTLARAWGLNPPLPLQIAGEGPLASLPWPERVTMLGQQPHDRVLELMRHASVLVFPSVWYECNPMTILEAFACGLPVIASDLGAMREMVEHRRTGLLFRAGDAEDLARTVRWAFDHPDELARMRVEARREYEAEYTAERNYSLLMDIYAAALERRRSAA